METKNIKISPCNCTGHGMHFLLLLGFLCHSTSDRIELRNLWSLEPYIVWKWLHQTNRFETKRLYWILVWSIGIVELISSGSVMYVFQQKLSSLNLLTPSWIRRPQRLLRSFRNHQRPQLSYLWVFEEISTKITTFKVELRTGGSMTTHY
jgi:hypothetical protein